MANAFDRFDAQRSRTPEPAGNPFDAFDEVAETETSGQYGPSQSSNAGRSFPKPERTSGMGLQPPENYDSFVEATAKSLGNVPERLQQSFGGLVQMLGEDMGQDREQFMQQSAGRLGITPQEYKLLAWAGNEGLVDPETPIPDALESLKSRMLTELSPEQQAQVADMGLINPETISAKGRELRDDAQSTMEPVNAEPGSPEYYTSAAIGSIAEMTPALIASALTRNPAVGMTIIGGQVGGESYGTARDEGLSVDESQRYAFAQAAAEAIPEYLPISKILKPGANFFKKMFDTAIAESLQEGVTAALQAGIDKDTIRPDMTWGEARGLISDSMIIGGIAGPGMAAITEPLVRYRNRQSPEGQDPEAAPPVLTETPTQPAPDADVSATGLDVTPSEANPFDVFDRQPSVAEAAAEVGAGDGQPVGRNLQASELASESQSQEQPESPEPALTEQGTGVFRVPVDQINVDPEQYQFRSRVNNQGVDKRLEGVQQWDDKRAGSVLLHRREDGSLYVADGHHRVDLARRLRQGEINAQVVDEADGVTVEQARVEAAMNNIADGKAEPLDVAKVFRDSEVPANEIRSAYDLPSNQVVRDGESLSSLSDNVFGMVTAGQMTEKDGAAIGSAFTEQAQQEAAAEAFQKVQPDTEYQRQLLVNEIRAADFAKAQGEQGGLFGDDPQEVSLMQDRLKVLDSLRQRLNSDKRLFKSLNDNADRAGEAGNQIATEANESITQQSARSLDLIGRVTTTPALNDMVNRAARRVYDGENRSKVVTELKQELMSYEQGADAEVSGERGQAQGRRATTKTRQEPRNSEPVPEPDTAGTDQGGQPESQQQEVAPALDLEAQTEEQLAEQARAREEAQQAETEQRRQEEQRAQADEQVDSFTLAGSDRQVDQAEAQGQSNLFDQPVEPESDSEPQPDPLSELESTEDPRFSRTGPRNLFVAHNLSEQNLEYVMELGGLAAPSLAVGRTDQGFSDFGEITLLAPASMLESSRARTFDADVYTPRQPRPEYEIDRTALQRQIEGLDNEYDLDVPAMDDLERDGMEAMARSPAYQYAWLKSRNKAPKAKRQKVDPVVRKIAKLGLDRFAMQTDPRVMKLAKAYYRDVQKQVREALGEDAPRANIYFDEDGDVSHGHLSQLTYKAARYQESDGYDVGQMKVDLNKKLRPKIAKRQYERWIKEQFNEVMEGKRMFNGFTYSGNRRYKPYTLENVVKEMTRQVQGGEGFNYGAGSVRSRYAQEMKRISQVQANRDRIVSPDEMARLKDESNERLQEVLSQLKPYYRFDADSWGYTDDASSAIGEGPRGWNEAFDLDAEGRAIITEFVDYLRNLPTAYFETKVGRAVDLAEFSVAIVPKGTSQETVDILRAKGLKVKRYDPADPESRRQEIAKQEDLLFSKSGEYRRTPESRTATLTAQQARTYANTLMRDWKGRPRVTVADSISEFPKPLREAIRQAGAESDMRAVFWNQEVFILAPRIPSTQALEEVILHEVVGHYGLRKMVGKELLPLLNRVYMDMAKTEQAAEIKRNYFPGNTFDSGNREHRLVVAEELLAHLAESGKQRHRTLWQRIVTAIRDGLRRLGFTVSMNENDLLKILEGAQRTVEQGGFSRPSEADTYFRRAYHGTPHRFDKFSLEAIGTGEGAQAYGYGLYFAEKREIAEYYKDVLSNDRMDDAAPDDVAEAFFDELSKDSATGDTVTVGDNQTRMTREEFVEAWMDEDIGPFDFSLAVRTAVEQKFSGNLYEVEIPDDSQLLDWGKRLNDQPAGITDAVRAVTDEYHGEGTFDSWMEANEEGGDYREWADNLMEDMSPQEISQALNDKGVPGLRYLDAVSRIPGEDGTTYNYVIWDDGLVSVQAINDQMAQAEALFSRASQTNTEAFRKWFGDSVITDDNDAPMVMYHGSRHGKFDAFRPSMHDENALYGISFSPDPKVAERYANNEDRQRDLSTEIQPQVYSVYIQSDRLPDTMTFINEVESHFKTDDYTSIPWDDVVAWARDQGIRALDASDIGVPNEIFVIDPTAIKSADNTGTFDPANPDIRFSRAGVPDLDPQPFGPPSDTLIRKAVSKIADKFTVLKGVQKNIQEIYGDIPEQANAYRAEELFHGKVENDIRLIEENMVEPLAKAMSDSDVSLQQLDEFLYALHAPERNAVIAERNPEIPEGGSGMTDAEAAEIINKVEKSGKLKQYQALAKRVHDMLAMRRKILRTASLLDEETVGAWEASYKNYVPLKGWAADEQQSDMPRIGKGFAIAGKESQMAAGRKSRAASPLANTISDLSEAVLRRRKNEVGNAFMNLVEAYPNGSYWQVYTDENPEVQRKAVKVKDPETGKTKVEVREQTVPMAMMSDRYFTTKRDGKTYYIKIEDERLMNAMRNIGPDSTNLLTRSLAAVTRVMSSLNTSYNPEFVISNFSRDIQTALLNLTSEQSSEDGKARGKKIAAKTLKDTPKAIRAINASLKGSTLTGNAAQWQAHFDQFRKDGAKTGWFDMKDIDGQMKDLEKMIEMAGGGALSTGRRAFQAVTEWVENTNSAIENGVRLAAYVNAIEAGISRSEAASLAKNMTVNFNRKGELGTMMNALYMFANASVQGTANFVRTLGRLNGVKGDQIWQRMHTAQKIAAGMAVGGFMLSLLNRLVAGEDEDEVNWWDKVPDYVKERNIVIMKSLAGGEPGEYWTIPLPYGYNIFPVIGTSMEHMAFSDKPAGDIAGNVVLAALGSFSPIGFEQSEEAYGLIAKNIMPTILRPVASISLNENFMGGPIFKENFPFGTQKPDSALYFRSTPEAFKALAEGLNDATGGSEFRSGAVDLSPDVMQFLVGYYGGGAYDFFTSRTPNFLTKLATGVELEDREIPFTRKLTGKVLPYEDQSIFYDRRNEIQQLADERKNLKGRERIQFSKEYREKLRLQPIVKSTEDRLKMLREQRDRIESMDLSAAEEDKRLQQIEKRMKRAIDQFNKRYNAAED